MNSREAVRECVQRLRMLLVGFQRFSGPRGSSLQEAWSRQSRWGLTWW